MPAIICRFRRELWRKQLVATLDIILQRPKQKHLLNERLPENTELIE